MIDKTKAAQEVWNKLGLGVCFLWSNVAYRVVRWPEQGEMGGIVCQIRRLGKGGQVYGSVRRFTLENCVIELPQILRGKDE